MWKLFNFLFGWDYIYWSNSADQGVARVYCSHDGKAFYFRYRILQLVDVIKQPDQVVWLTCEPSKYLRGSK